jgi:Ca2+-binding RTX toxin-like protein
MASVAVSLAVVSSLAYVASSLVMGQRPAFALSANKGFFVTSAIYTGEAAGRCTGSATAQLYPGADRCLGVTVHNPLSVAIDVNALSMAVSSFTPAPSNPRTSPACTTTMVNARPIFTRAFTVAANAAWTIDEPIALKTAGTQDACAGGTFNFTFSGSANYADSTTTVLTAASSRPTTATLTATVVPGNPGAIPYGPQSATAPVHHVTFYSCGASAACGAGSKSSLKTVTLVTAAGVPTATFSVTGLSPGRHFFEASYPATASNPGTFAGSTSAVESVTVATVLPAVCKGRTFKHNFLYPFPPFAFGTNQSDLIVLGNWNYVVNGFQGSDCIAAGNGDNAVVDGTGDDGIQAGNGWNRVVLGGGNDTVVLGDGTDSVVAGGGGDTVTLGNGPSDHVVLGSGNDSVTVGNGDGDVVKVGAGTDTVDTGTGAFDSVVLLGGGTDTVSLTGSHDSVWAGTGTDTVYLGSGMDNVFHGFSDKKDTCRLAGPPSRYHDTITKCTVVAT